jgi:hypothetical protein
MAVRSKTRSSAVRHPPRGGGVATKKQTVEAIFESYGLPGWLGWGTMGAESTYGTNGSYAFGGIDLANSGTGNWPIEAREAAAAYKGLVAQYGSVPAAVPHYSGNSYDVGHVRELSLGGGSSAREKTTPQQLEASAHAVNVDWSPLKLSPLYRLFNGETPLPQFPGQEDLPFGGGTESPATGGSLGELNPGGLLEVPEQLVQAGTAVTAFLSMLTSIQFWIRVGEAIGAFILIYIALKELI